MRKVVILPEKGEEDMFSVYPLVEAIFQENPESDVTILHHLDLARDFSFFPRPLKYYLFNEKSLGPLGSLKEAERLVDVFNIDTMICMREDVPALQFAKAFRAKERIGYKSLVNDVFLNHSYKKEDFPYSDQKNLQLWQKFTGKGFDDLLLKRDLDTKHPENFFNADSVGPYLFLALSDLEEKDGVFSLCYKLLESLKEQKVIIWSHESNAFTKELAALDERFVDASEADGVHLDKYIALSKGVLTDMLWVSRLSSYLSVEHFYLYTEEKIKPLKRFPIGPMTFGLKDSQGVFQDYPALEEPEEMTEEGFIDKVHSRLNL